MTIATLETIRYQKKTMNGFSDDRTSVGSKRSVSLEDNIHYTSSMKITTLGCLLNILDNETEFPCSPIALIVLLNERKDQSDNDDREKDDDMLVRWKFLIVLAHHSC